MVTDHHYFTPYIALCRFDVDLSVGKLFSACPVYCNSSKAILFYNEVQNGDITKSHVSCYILHAVFEETFKLPSTKHTPVLFTLCVIYAAKLSVTIFRNMNALSSGLRPSAEISH